MSAKQTKAAAEQIDAAVNAGKESVEKAMKAGTDGFRESYDQVVAVAREQIEKLFPAAVKNFDELANFHKGNVDAVFEAGAIAAKGFEAIGKEVFAYNQKAFETGAETAKTFLGCKTVEEAVELQAGLTRENFDDLVAEGAKLSKLTVKVTDEATAPLNARFGKAAETFAKPVAA